MAAGKPEKALCILQRIAKENNKELPPGELVATEKHEVCLSAWPRNAPLVATSTRRKLFGTDNFQLSDKIHYS